MYQQPPLTFFDSMPYISNNDITEPTSSSETEMCLMSIHSHSISASNSSSSISFRIPMFVLLIILIFIFLKFFRIDMFLPYTFPLPACQSNDQHWQSGRQNVFASANRRILLPRLACLLMYQYFSPIPWFRAKTGPLLAQLMGL